MHVYKDRLSLLKDLAGTDKASLKSCTVTVTDEIFVATYKECDKGKDKYARFQVMSHQNITFLLEPTSSDSGSHILWAGPCFYVCIARDKKCCDA